MAVNSTTKTRARGWERKCANRGIYKEILGAEALGSRDHVVNWYRPDGSLTVDVLAAEYADLAVASVTG